MNILLLILLAVFILFVIVLLVGGIFLVLDTILEDCFGLGVKGLIDRMRQGKEKNANEK